MLRFLKKEWLSIVFILADLVAAIILYPILPEKIPTHWGITGQIDGWGPKNIAVFGIVGMVVGIYVLMSVIPAFDPKKHNYEKFAKFYAIIKTGLVVFFSIIYALTLMAALKVPVKMDMIMTLLMGLLFMFLGNYMFTVKQNWFVGVRTPWTIEDEEVWNRTHRLAGKLWVAGGAVMLISAFFNPVVGFVVLTVVSLIPVVYSYVIYKKKRG